MSYEILGKSIYSLELAASRWGLEWPESPTIFHCLLAGSLANLGAWPESAKEPQTPATSGRKCFESLALSGRDGCLAKMYLALTTSDSWHSTERALTWKASVTKSGLRSKFRLVPSTRPTNEADSGSLHGMRPTVRASLSENRQTRRTPSQKAWKHGLNLATIAMETETFREMWPTPTARDHKSGAASEQTMARNARPPSEVAFWSTVRASDGAKGGPNQKFGAGGQPLPAQAFGTAQDGPKGAIESSGGSLNPEFVSWLMGYPEGWQK